jgi:pyruvate ferredoxin oxidoreductase gamma subunit
VRIDASKPIVVRAEIQEPDVVVVLDPGLLRIMKVTAGLKPGGIVVVNTTKPLEQISQEFGLNGSLATVDATHIAREILGVPIVNTTMIGAVVKATGIIKLESVLEPLSHRFGRQAEKNLSAMKRAFEDTIVREIR